MFDDYSSDRNTSGQVTVGGSATGTIETRDDRDWFAVTLVAGRTYRIDLEGSATGAGSLTETYLRGIYDANENFIPGTGNLWSGEGFNSRVIFTPTADGTYYVAAEAWADSGTYTLSVTEIADGGADDFAATSGTTGEVEVGGSATGVIESPRDRDWFAVTLEAGKTYRIDLEGLHTGAGSMHNPRLRGIYDTNENRIPGTGNDNHGEGLNSRVFFTPTEDATYYIAAGAYRREAGSYTLSVTEITDESDDFTADTTTTGAVEVGGSATGELETPGDRDWFAVDLEADTTYRIDLEGVWTGAGSLTDPRLHGIYDGDTNLLAGTTDDNGGYLANSQVYFAAPEDATYYVAAGVSAHLDYLGDYTLSVTEVADDFLASTRTSGALDVGDSVMGEIQWSGDRDWFAVDLVAGTTYRIDQEGVKTDAGSLIDPYLRGIYDKDANLIPGTANDDGGKGLNSRLFFTAAEDGTYYVAAGVSAYLDYLGDYTLSVTELGADDFPASIGTSGAVEVGGSVTGAINFKGDRDWFAVTLEADATYRIDLEGSPTAAGSLSNPYLRGIHDSDADLISGTKNDNGGTGKNSQVEFTAGDAGTYYIAAGAWGNGTGDYTLSVVELDGL